MVTQTTYRFYILERIVMLPKVGDCVLIQFAEYDESRPEHKAIQGRVGRVVDNTYSNRFTYAVRIADRIVIGAEAEDLTVVKGDEC